MDEPRTEGARPSRSRLLISDPESARLLSERGLLPVGAPFASDVAAFFEACERRGARCSRASVATYVADEAVLGTAFGRLLGEAAAAGGVEIYYDAHHGPTRGLAERLADVRRGALHLGALDRSGQSGSFHPKLLCLHLDVGEHPRVALTLVGSANLTGAAMSLNDEVGVLFCRRLPVGGGGARTGVEALDALFQGYAAEAVAPASIEELPARLPEEPRAREVWVPRVRLRDYQEEAVEALIRAYSRRRPRDSARRRWKGAMLALPPATGKTLIALAAAMRLMRPPKPRARVAIWVAPGPELALQAFEEMVRSFLLGSEEASELEAYCLQEKLVRVAPSADAWGVRPEEMLRRLMEESTVAGPGRFVFVGKQRLERLQAKLDLDGWADLVIADEAHHSIARGWNDVLGSLRPRTVFGITATPFVREPRSKRTKALLNAYPLGEMAWTSYFPRHRRREVRANLPRRGGGGHIAYGRSLFDFLEEDRRRPKLERVIAEPTMEVVQLLERDGEPLRVHPAPSRRIPPHRRLEMALSSLDGEQSIDRVDSISEVASHRAHHLQRKVEEPEVLATALTTIDWDALGWAQRLMEEKLVVLFARGSGHARLLRRQAEWLGLSTERTLAVYSSDGRSPGLRRYEVQRLRKAGRGLLICVDMLAEGTDLRRANALVVTRWTTSERLYWQMVGRGLRGPDSGGTGDVRVRLYDVDFVHGEGKDEVLARASTALLEEFEEAGVVVEETRIPFDAHVRRPARPRRVVEAEGATRKAPRTIQRRVRGPMIPRDMAKLRAYAPDAYVYWVESESGEPCMEPRPVRHPYRAVKRRWDEFSGWGYWFVVMREDVWRRSRSAGRRRRASS